MTDFQAGCPSAGFWSHTEVVDTWKWGKLVAGGRAIIVVGLCLGLLALLAGCFATEDSRSGRNGAKRRGIAMATPWEAPVPLYSDDPAAAPRKKKLPLPVPRRAATRHARRDAALANAARSPSNSGAAGDEALPPDLETDTGPENRVTSSGLASLQLGPDDKGSERDDPGTDPGWLIGLDQEGTIYLLGQPNIKIEQPPARVWQYNGNNCTLRLFLYLDMVTVRYRTLFYEIRGVDAEDIDAKRRCVAWLLADRSRGS